VGKYPWRWGKSDQYRALFCRTLPTGTGMDAAAGVVEANFGIDVPYVIRIKFDGLIAIVDAMGE
jgi:anionic cell wall polymer biosynthesis LytR-Cps2A-Psr (LCP) family protein